MSHLRVPPHTFRAVRDWMVSLWAGHVWAWAEDQLKGARREVLRFRGSGKVCPHYYRQKVACSLLVIRECKKYATKPKRYKSHATKTFQVDWRDWTYLAGRDAPVPEYSLSTITCVLNFKPRKTQSGCWNTWESLLSVDVRTGMGRVFEPKDFESTKNSLVDIITHEFRHFAQAALTDCTLERFSGKKAGLPPCWVRTKGVDHDGYKLNRRNRVEHCLRDIEFYPRLSEHIRPIYENLAAAPPHLRRLIAHTMLADGHDGEGCGTRERFDEFRRQPRDILGAFREALPHYISSETIWRIAKADPARYRKIVAEVYKAISPLLEETSAPG